jgi:hypothetical protein
VCVQAALAEGLRTEEALTSRAALLAAAYPHKLLEVLLGYRHLTRSHTNELPSVPGMFLTCRRAAFQAPL